MVVYETGVKSALGWAHELRLKHWYGLWPGAKEARFSRASAADVVYSSGDRLRRLLWNQISLPGLNLSDADYAASVQQINAFQPQVLWGITSALAGLAEYIREGKAGTLTHHPALLITWAEPLLGPEKSLLEEVFDSPVTSLYSTKESGHIAAICPCGSLHVNQEHYLVEIERDAADSPGEIIVTALVEVAMPFIRYKTGDVGKLATGHCECGRTLQVLELEGARPA